MNADPRLICLRLCGGWLRKVELDEISLDNAWSLLIERIGAVVPAFKTCPTCNQTPCPNPSFCQGCREADRELAQKRRCAQCGAGGSDLEPHQDRDRKRIVYLHRGACERFWKSRNR